MYSDVMLSLQVAPQCFKLDILVKIGYSFKSSVKIWPFTTISINNNYHYLSIF